MEIDLPLIVYLYTIRENMERKEDVYGQQVYDGVVGGIGCAV